MLGQPFYFSTIRKTVVGIGAMFNNLHLIDFDNLGAVVKDIKVPLSYAKREGYWSKLREEQQNATPGSTAGVRMSLPRMSFDMVGMDYDASRQKHALNKRSVQSPTNVNMLKKQLGPVPYNLSFEVNIYTKDVEDGLQLIEQILPTFTPSYNISIKMIPDMNIVEDVQVVLDSVSSEDSYESGLEENRIITWTLQLTAKTHIYQPITEQATIKSTLTTIYNQPNMTNMLSSMGVTVSPAIATRVDTHNIITTSTLGPNQ